MYNGYITTLKNVRPHPNADRLVLADCFGNTVCVSNDYEEGMLCVYFPTDGQLSMEFCQQNNLLRLYDEEGHSIPGGGYMDPKKRNVSAIRLRGEKSDGLALPISCLDYCFEGETAETHLKIGDVINVVNGHDICIKYIPKRNKSGGNPSPGSRTRKRRAPIAPLFAEHVDTEQLAYNLGDFRTEDEVEISLKLHGTSQRTGYLPVLKGYRRTIIDRLLRRDGEPIYAYDYVTGTRRTVIESEEGGFYGDHKFRMLHAKTFEGKLWKGETVYYEVVGFTDTGTPIMAECENKKVNDKEFVKRYGKTTTFSYGCERSGKRGFGITEEKVPQSDIYVYRMSMTNEDGNVVEYTPDFMRYRCEQIGVKTVPVFWKGTIPVIENDEALSKEYWISPGDYIKELAEEYYEGPDPIGKTHIREGVVVRIINRPKFCAYKHKNFEFKVLENIIKTNAEAPDMEEADGLEDVDTETV